MNSVTRLAALGFALLGCSTSSSPATVSDAGSGDATGDARGGTGTVTLEGTVTDRDTSQPLAGSIVIVEVGGIYQPNPDPTQANPFYKISALVAADGTFSVDVPAGAVGLHTFQNGYYYGVLGIKDVGAKPTGNAVTVKALLPLDVKPTTKNLTLTPSTVAAGGQVSLSVEATHAPRAGDAGADAGADPLSEEIIAAETTTHWAAILKPPTPGQQGVESPDGIYTTTFAAPSTPGTYTYALVGSSEGCITSDRLTATLTVQ